MKYCSKCGSEINDEAVVCVHCGCAVEGFNNSNIQDAPSTGFCILGFCIPLVGLILWLVWKDEYPLKAKSVGQGALICVIFYALIYIISFVLGFSQSM